MAYKHSEDQITAINTFIEFLKDDSQVLIISGSAGTGKTSLIKDYAKASKQNNWNYSIFFTLVFFRKILLIIKNFRSVV